MLIQRLKMGGLRRMVLKFIAVFFRLKIGGRILCLRTLRFWSGTFKPLLVLEFFYKLVRCLIKCTIEKLET